MRWHRARCCGLAVGKLFCVLREAWRPSPRDGETPSGKFQPGQSGVETAVGQAFFGLLVAAICWDGLVFLRLDEHVSGWRAIAWSPLLLFCWIGMMHAVPMGGWLVVRGLRAFGFVREGDHMIALRWVIPYYLLWIAGGRFAAGGDVPLWGKMIGFYWGVEFFSVLALLFLSQSIRSQIGDFYRDRGRVILALANGAAPLVSFGLWLGGWGLMSLGPLFAVHLTTLFFILMPNQKIWGAVRNRVKTVERKVWLSFDDGPDPEEQGVILEWLEKYHVRGIFFCIGERVERYPEAVRAIVDGDHVLGNHTMTHPEKWFWSRTAVATQREIVAAQEVFQRVVGADPQLFRAPVGMINPWVHPILREMGLSYCGWSARGFDGRRQDVDQIVARIQRQVRPGGIILIHQGRRTPEGRSQAVAILEKLLPWLEQEGYALGSWEKVMR